MAGLINRRGFLASLAAAVLADPERLLWRPGAKTISIPKPVVHQGVRFAKLDGTVYIALFSSSDGQNGPILERYVEIPTPIPPVVTFDSPASWGVIEQACVVDAQGRFYPIDLNLPASVEEQMGRILQERADAISNEIDRSLLSDFGLARSRT